jgi:hypothetical protein
MTTLTTTRTTWTCERLHQHPTATVLSNNSSARQSAPRLDDSSSRVGFLRRFLTALMGSLAVAHV